MRETMFHTNQISTQTGSCASCVYLSSVYAYGTRGRFKAPNSLIALHFQIAAHMWWNSLFGNDPMAAWCLHRKLLTRFSYTYTCYETCLRFKSIEFELRLVISFLFPHIESATPVLYNISFTALSSSESPPQCLFSSCDSWCVCRFVSAVWVFFVCVCSWSYTFE